MSITIKIADITKLKTDAIVNAANSGLAQGGGVCGAIFRAAGPRELTAACNKYPQGCPTGSAVITPGFNLPAKYVIHAVGPIWQGGNSREPQLLYSAYKSSLELAKKNGLHSIAFPLISSGIYRYPKDQAWRKALQACNDFLNDTGYDIDITFAVLDYYLFALGMNTRIDLMTGRKGPISHIICFHNPDEPHGYLSNWYLSDMTIDGIRFSSVEQWMMYSKAAFFKDEEYMQKILTTNDPGTIKEYGRSVRNFDEDLWADASPAIIYKGLYNKFAQNEDLKAQLLSTDDALLVECARTDHIWAIGRRMDDPRRLNMEEWDGLNRLGFLLMEVRTNLLG